MFNRMGNPYFKYLKQLFRKDNRLISLVFFITNRCNLRCSHCFLWNKLGDSKQELTLEEINRLSKSMDDFLSLSLTGGEPFLRDDIVDISEIFYKNNHIRNLSIPTNGLLSDEIISSAEKILSKCSNLSLNLAISLDGLEETHDKIRGLKGSFDKAIDTYFELKEIADRDSKLTVEIITVMSRNNQHELDKFYDFVIGELKPDSVNLSPIRGNVKDPSFKDIDVNIYESIAKRIQRTFLFSTIRGYDNFSFSEYVFALRMIEPQMVATILRENKYQTECYAGILSGVLYSRGDLFACELLDKKIGNIRDVDYDFKKLWFSKKAMEIRKYIKDTRCFCIHPCNFTVNILFNIKYIPKLLLYGLRLKLSRLLRKTSH